MVLVLVLVLDLGRRTGRAERIRAKATLGGDLQFPYHSRLLPSVVHRSSRNPSLSRTFQPTRISPPCLEIRPYLRHHEVNHGPDQQLPLFHQLSYGA